VRLAFMYVGKCRASRSMPMCCQRTMRNIGLKDEKLPTIGFVLNLRVFYTVHHIKLESVSPFRVFSLCDRDAPICSFIPLVSLCFRVSGLYFSLLRSAPLSRCWFVAALVVLAVSSPCFVLGLNRPMASPSLLSLHHSRVHYSPLSPHPDRTNASRIYVRVLDPHGGRGGV
jgi:hypothetical protein